MTVSPSSTGSAEQLWEEYLDQIEHEPSAQGAIAFAFERLGGAAQGAGDCGNLATGEHANEETDPTYFEPVQGGKGEAEWQWQGNHLVDLTGRQTLLRDVTFWNITDEQKRMIERAPAAPQPASKAYTGREPGFVKPDTDRQVFFYEQDFYVLSNFSAFNLRWAGLTFPTSEHAYHWEKFNSLPQNLEWIARDIRLAPSAHEAFKLADKYRQYRRSDWDAAKINIMRLILSAKAEQHEYVRRKLLATGDRELIEDSWRDDFWGWGPNRDGKNMLGKLWMEVRAELRASALPSTHQQDAAK